MGLDSAPHSTNPSHAGRIGEGGGDGASKEPGVPVPAKGLSSNQNGGLRAGSVLKAQPSVCSRGSKIDSLSDWIVALQTGSVHSHVQYISP